MDLVSRHSKVLHSEEFLKEFPADRIVTIAETKLQGFSYELRRKPERPMVKLSPRDRDVLEGIQDGLPNKGIAAKLKLSVNTVNSYVSRLLKKFQVDSRVLLALVELDATHP